MQETYNNEEHHTTLITEDTNKFKGYSLSELRYQRAIAAVKKEYAKEKTFRTLRNIRSRSVFGSDKAGKLRNAGNMISKIAGGLNYADYAMLGFSLFGTVRKFANVLGFFKKKKK